MMDLMTTTPFYHINTTDATGRNGSMYEYDEEYDYRDEHAELRQSLNFMSIIVYCLAIVLGVLGNGLVIWVTGFKMKKTVNTVWFLNLAVADFLSTPPLLLSATYLALEFHWPFGKFMCKLNAALIFLNIYASVYIMVVISADRYVSVVWPVWAQNHRNVRKASLVSLVVWVLALILSVPYFVFRDTISFDNNEVTVCFNNLAFPDDFDNPSVSELIVFRYKALIITRFLLAFIVPFTIIVSCYAVIIHRLRRNRTLASQSSRTFKIIAAVIITFFFCWAPFHIFAIIDLVHASNNFESKTLEYVTTIGSPLTISLAFIIRCLNPLLYVFVGQDFRDKIRKSILTVLETAFQEDASGSHTETSALSSQNKEMAINNSEL